MSRPIGAAVFGNFGDRLGRKKTLIATLLIMALSTVTVGMVPSAAAIGVAAPLILVALRLLQGFAVGGHWAGSALLGPTRKAELEFRFGRVISLALAPASNLVGQILGPAAQVASQLKTLSEKKEEEPAPTATA